MDKKRVRKISTMAEMQAALQAAFNAINKNFYGGELRRKVYEKYGGHCAYCGKKIDYDEMQVDHLVRDER